MVILRMKAHWIACRKLRQGVPEEKLRGYSALRIAQAVSKDRIVQKAAHSTLQTYKKAA